MPSTDTPASQLGPKLSQLLANPGITDLLINGHRDLWIGNSPGRLVRGQSPFESEAELGGLAQHLISAGGRHLDQANPFADVTLAGYRIHAALASGCVPETHMSIRVHANKNFSLQQLFDSGGISEVQLSRLREILHSGESFLIAGATGSGKTTLLRAMLAECGDERIIALEDVAELNLANVHFVALQTRQPNIEGRGEITLERLVRESLRMNPDRLVVGEVRGAELLAMLQALNTGHRGAATVHANSIEDVLVRLHSMVMGLGVTEANLVAQSTSAFDWLIQTDAQKVVAIKRFEEAGRNA
ncbi:MAG: CpaF family protein [Rhodoluna sp.]